MSEKRFILDSDFVKVTSEVVWDNQEEKGLTLMKLVDLLNKIYEENEQLKHYKLYEDNKRLQTIIADLKKENEQLRQELNGKDCRKCGNYCRDKALDYCLVDEREPVYFSPFEWDYKAVAEKCKYYYR